MNKLKSVLLSCLAVLLINGCQKDFNPVIGSGYSKSDVAEDAKAWASAGQGRDWAYVKPTGSMEPFLNENSIVLLEPYVGQDFNNGRVVVFDRGDVINVIHVVVDQTDTMVYISGYNNHVSDGWFPKTKISYLQAGILFTKP